MNSSFLDTVTENLVALIQYRETFQSSFDPRAGEFLEGLPGLFHLFQRLTFDLEIAPEYRRKAALIAIYIAEPHDYFGESNGGVERLIDDLWLAYTGLYQLTKEVPINLLQRHWRSEIPLSQVIHLSNDLPSLEKHVPSRVLERLKAFIEP